jgi:16S rRNA A1518/A1519 N6-dimethyltransferase RsmA/KsgA/DIM1 with predicted DNA glycosylase/AP lyase activity
LIAAAFGQRRKTIKNALIGSRLDLEAEAVAQALAQAGHRPVATGRNDLAGGLHPSGQSA